MQSQQRIALIGLSKDHKISQITVDGSGVTSSNGSRIPRLARKDLSTPGTWRERVHRRENRNMEVMQLGCYRAEMPARLQHGNARDGYKDEEQSYLYEGVRDAKTETGYMNAATSAGGKWIEKSEDVRIARDEGCAERKVEDQKTWIRLPKLSREVVDDDEVSARMDENAGKASPGKRAPTSVSAFGKMSTDDKSSRGSFHSSCTNSSSSSQPTHPPLTALFSNLDHEFITQDTATPSSPILSSAALDALLDASIEKTCILLAAGREALKSTAGADFEGPGLYAYADDADTKDDATVTRDLKADSKEEPTHSLTHLLTYNNPITVTTPFTTDSNLKARAAEAEEEEEAKEAERKAQRTFAQSVETAVANGIIRVENWYKVKGAGENWREIEMGGRENLVGLVVDEDACESADCMF